MIETPSVANPEVLAAIERAKALAIEHQCGYVGIALATRPNNGMALCVGEIELEQVGRETVEHLLAEVNKSIANGAFPDKDPELDASHQCYSVISGSIGFDFFVWLVAAEMERRREEAPGPLKVGFWFGKDQEKCLAEPNRRHWLENVYRPGLSLIGAVEDPYAVHGRQNDIYVGKAVVEPALRGETVPTLVGPHYRYDVAEAITITLREATKWPHRNSNLVAWLKFATDLKRKGHRVIFVRDTAKATEGLAGFEVDPVAALDIPERMALYQSARANLFISNGPATFAVYGDRPWLQFIPVEDMDSTYRVNKPDFWKDAHGIVAGEGQYPWSLPCQRIVWKPDTYENLRAAWEELEPLL